MSTAPKFPARPANWFCSARPGPELIYYKIVQWFNYFLWGEGTKTYENIVKYGYNL